MNSPYTIRGNNLLRNYISILLGWSVLVGCSLAWNIYQERDETLNMVTTAARTTLTRDILFRKWVASHGGVYVPPTDTTPPNPYLKVPDRDEVTTKGKLLTLMNPAYALRDLQELIDNDSGIKRHMSSLLPINPQNAADEWEAISLRRFEKGEKEVMEILKSEGQSHLRMMIPLLVAHECLSCHEQQGYKLGDIRGGISTTVSLQNYQVNEQHRINISLLTHAVIWLAGVFSLMLFFRRVRILQKLRKEAEDKLIEREALFRNYFEQGQIGMCITSNEQKWLRVNRRLCEMLGYTEQELLHMTWTELTHPDDLMLDLTQFKMLLDNKIEHYDLDKRFIHKNGKTVFTHLAVSCQRKHDGSIDYVIASLDDITERIQREKEANEMREQLIQSAKMASIGKLTAGIAHNFNNILGAIMGYTELSQQMLAAGKLDAIAGYQAEILKSSNRAKELVQQMLTFSSMSPKGREEETPVTTLSTIICEAITLIRPNIPFTISINYRVEDERLKTPIQPFNLHQILFTLIGNARDAIGEYGKIDISLTAQHFDNKICSSCMKAFSGDYAQITVEDNGSGIPDNILSKIFDPFFTTKDVGKGSGMGLSVTHGLVHAQGGHIYVESTPGAGSKFNILLPINPII